jgi:DNA primase
VIAFTARALDADDKGGPKYLNSPETPLYSKGQVLFNLDKARQAIRQQNFALLVEGQMDCISVFAAGVTPVLATSGTAFTEQQARLLRRYTTRLVVNFDPDTAGANAAEKSIALLTEEGFEVRVVTLEGGLDPDRFVRERGVQAYAEALKGAARHSDYLIERARKLFPVRTAQGKVEAVNFLLPHIRRMPHAIVRDEFAQDAAQKLGVDSALLRQELKQAAAKRQGQIPPMTASNLSECERVLLRALAGLPESETFRRAAEAMDAQAEHFEGLGIWTALQKLAGRGDADPIEAVGPEARGLVAQLLMREAEPVTRHELESALITLERHSVEHRQRRLRGAIAEAERKGDLAGVTALITERMKLDRRLGELDRKLRELLGQE